MKVGIYLVNLMKKLGLTQQRLADLTGLSQSYISHICSDRNQPTLDTIEKICQAAGIPVSSFFSDGELLVANVTDSISRLNYEEACLIAQFRIISEKERRIVSDLVETFADNHYEKKVVLSRSLMSGEKSIPQDEKENHGA